MKNFIDHLAYLWHDVNENWIEIETKKGYELINADFIESIKIMSN